MSANDDPATLSEITDSLIHDYDALVARSSSGLRTCKEALAFVQERTKIEEAYGQALVKQARSVAGTLERGTCRMGLYAFKAKTESVGKKHLELAAHFTTDCTALQYLRDKQANAHKGLANECAGFVADARKATSGLAKARARCAELSKKLDAALLVQPKGQPPPPQQQALAKELELAYAAANEAVRGTQLQAGQMCAKLPKLLADFEKGEGQRIDSLKWHQAVVLGARGDVAAQRPILYAAADMVDAIVTEDLAPLSKTTPAARRRSRTSPPWTSKGKLRLDGQHAALVAAARRRGRRPVDGGGADAVDGGGHAGRRRRGRRRRPPRRRRRDVAEVVAYDARGAHKTITADFVMLSKDDAFASTDGGISLADVATGQRLRVTDAAQLVSGPSTHTERNTLTRVSNTQLRWKTPDPAQPPVVESAGAGAGDADRGGGGGGGVSAEAARRRSSTRRSNSSNARRRRPSASPSASSSRAAREI